MHWEIIENYTNVQFQAQYALVNECEVLIVKYTWYMQ